MMLIIKWVLLMIEQDANLENAAQEEITTAGTEDMRKKVVGIAGIEAEVDLTRL